MTEIDLPELRRVDGSLRICQTLVEELAGFPSLRIVEGDLVIEENLELRRIDDFPKLESVLNLRMIFHPALLEWVGTWALSVGDIEVNNAVILEDASALMGILEVRNGIVRFVWNNALPCDDVRVVMEHLNDVGASQILEGYADPVVGPTLHCTDF